MTYQHRILIVDDDDMTRKRLTQLLKKEGYAVSSTDNGANALALLAKNPHDLVLSDLLMDQIDGLELLTRIKAQFPDVEVILITGYASIQTAIEAMKKGAYHYLEKPLRPDEVRHLVRRAVEKRQLQEQVKTLKTRLMAQTKEPLLIGQSRKILEIVDLLKQVAQANCNLLLMGESGTGKELAASLIHYHSRSRDKNFLAINCGSFAEDLLANELFGHEKGAFTGADAARAGLLETASGGTLFLDEIGEMPPSMQVKLLRAIQQQEVIRVGGSQPIPIDVRIISATNKDLKKAVNEGRFREDLYYRLNVVSIVLPTLRERKEDIPLLANFFLSRLAKRSGKRITGFSDEVIEVLTNYYFPGNVRELENIVERAVAMTRKDTIQLADLPPDLLEMKVFSFVQYDANIKPLREMEQDYIQWVLDKVGRNRTRAAKLLGIDRSSLWRHLKSFEIED
ncbi:MAG: Fis family transcriptional regulator [Nitrospira bacterium SM23_35]|nr:MAG: Fis family transcriptional regulator [Nitrospira bacterium SM23_35]